jgi:hypothetical protein
MLEAKANNYEEQLFQACETFVNSPLGFTNFMYPWRVEGTPLARHDGPDKWQAEVMLDIERALEDPNQTGPIQIAVSSGHGIGKTAEIAWILRWFSSTRPNPQIITTANTQAQLSGKTWRELAKWHNLSYNAHWFKWTATRYTFLGAPETWFATAQPWTKERAEAFAGTHEDYVLMLFDESSLIDDAIWEVAEGAMTTTQCLWIVFGNPTRNTGRFRECFKRFRHRWITRSINSMDAKMTNKEVLQRWIEDYGWDSDFVKVRVRGIFPSASVLQLIPEGVVDAAVARDHALHVYWRSAKVMGVDVARRGDSKTVIERRHGLKALDPIWMSTGDTMQVVGKVAQTIDDWKPDAVFIDLGYAPGVHDRLQQLGYKIVTGVNFGGAATKPTYYNKRTEMWVEMKNWLENGGSIPDHQELKDDLIGPEYHFAGRMGQMLLEKKEDMLDRGLASPDFGDALALTFAYPVLPPGALGGKPKVAEIDYDLLN